MQSQLAAAQAELSANLAELRRDTGANASLIAQGDAQLATLLALKRQLDHASPAALVMIRAEIAASVAAASSTAQLAQISASLADQRAGSVELAHASEAARGQVSSFIKDFYERKKFDPYLEFASAEENEAYRKREADHERQIKEALALHTPEGNLRAGQLAAEQLRDAGAHGAKRSPDYETTLKGLEAHNAELSRQLAQQVSERAAPSPVKTTSPSNDPAAALLAAGVRLADDADVQHRVPVQERPSQTQGRG